MTAALSPAPSLGCPSPAGSPTSHIKEIILGLNLKGNTDQTKKYRSAHDVHLKRGLFPVVEQHEDGHLKG